MRRSFLVFFFLGVAAMLCAQQVMNNDAVIKMVKAGLSDDIVIASINAQPGAYNTATDGLVALKTAGVSDRVVGAMIAKASAPASPAAAASAAVANPDDPNSPHDPGIWVYSNQGSGPKMTELEPSVYSSGKTGGMFTTAMTYGIAKTKMLAIIRNAHSNSRVTDPNATFYFYFENTSAGLSNSSSLYASFFGGTSTPNEFVLLRFDVKKDTRETTVGKLNAFGASSGVDDKALVEFNYEKLHPGVYKVTPKAPLTLGEYGFMAPSSAPVTPYGGVAATSSHVFDFGCNAAN